jgi:hypothetical protein
MKAWISANEAGSVGNAERALLPDLPGRAQPGRLR